MLKYPRLGQLNQGSIFSCARADRYPGCVVSGVVLTARCDLEQEKYNVLNYAPVVSLKDWLKVDGYELVLSRIAADLGSRTESALRTINLPMSILNSQTPASILESYIRAPNVDKKVKKADEKFVELDRRAQQLVRWKEGYSVSNTDMFDQCDALARNVVRELIHHKLSGYYFLPKVEHGSEETGFVALLREVNHLPRQLALLIAGGFDATSHEFSQHPEWLTYIDFTLTDFAMPIGEIVSPYVEHLLQTFSHLFGRIGLPDPDRAKVDELSGIRPE